VQVLTIDSETKREFVHFLKYAKESCAKVRKELCVAVDQQYITKVEFQDVYDHAGRTCVAIRGFIKHFQPYKQGQQKNNPEPMNAYG